MIQILVTLDPATNALQIEGNASPEGAVVLLERAKLLALQQASKSTPAIQQPTPDQVKGLVGGRVSANGHG